MQGLLRDYAPPMELTTRRYPIDLQELASRLDADLQRSFDGVLHLGQSPGASSIKLEALAVNFAGRIEDAGQELPLLNDTGPLAFRSRMPVGRWAEALRNQKIPAVVSYHAGTSLCNATMYLSHLWYERRGAQVPVGFMHLPLSHGASCSHSSERPLPTSGHVNSRLATGVG